MKAARPLSNSRKSKTNTSAAVTRVGERVYRLDTRPIWVEGASFGDEIEADLQEDGSLRFRRVVLKASWRTFEYVLSRDQAESPALARLLGRVIESGGHWERVFGGCQYVFLPHHSEWDFESAFSVMRRDLEWSAVVR